MKKEPLGLYLVKTILVVSFIVSFGVMFGSAGYLNNMTAKIEQSPVSFVPEITVSPMPIVKDETAGWETYESNKFGFLMRYPSDWEVSDSTGFPGAQVIFDERNSTDSNPGVSVGQLAAYDDDRGRKITFEEMASDLKKNKLDTVGGKYTDEKGEILAIDGVNAIKWSIVKDGKYVDYIFSLLENEVFIITCYSENLEKNICKTTFKSMLSSFKFIEKEKLAYLGIIFKDVSAFNTKEDRKIIGIPEELNYGVFIIDSDLAKELNVSFSEQFPDGIIPGSPADVSKLKAKDVILEVNGEKVLDLEKIMEKLKPYEKIQVKILRDGKELNMEINLKEKPANLIN